MQLGKFVGWLLHRVVRFRRAIVMNHVQVAYGCRYSADELADLVSRIYRHLGLLLIELLRLPRISGAEVARKVIFHGEEHLIQARQKGKGVIVLTGHIGNWELAGAAYARNSYPTHAIGKEMKTAIGNALIQLVRHDNGVSMIAKRNSLREILTALKRNELVVFMLDQNSAGRDKVFVDFFGQLASTMPGLAIIAARSGAAVVPSYIYRDRDYIHHHCDVWPAVDLSDTNFQADGAVTDVTARCTKIIESMIEQHPDQWLWIHKRWRTRPAGETSSPFIYRRSRPAIPRASSTRATARA